MRFRLDSWRADHAFPYESQADDLDPAGDVAAVDVTFEAPAHEWAAIAPEPGTAPFPVVRFVDGVQCSDAVVWIDEPGRGEPLPGLVASWGAGVITSRPGAPVADRVVLERVVVERGVFSDARTLGPIIAGSLTWRPRTPELDGPPVTPGDPGALRERLGAARRRLEAAVGQIGHDDPEGLVVHDGLLHGGARPLTAVGLAKRAHRLYLPEPLRPLQRTLRRGERTPLFVTDPQRRRVSCYLALADPLPPAVADPGSCVARVEFALAPDSTRQDATAFADRVAATLPAYASEPHVDPRAPQNLMPIRSLEQELRRRLGRPGVIRAALAAQAAGSGTAA
jgi:uncharacterized protein